MGHPTPPQQASGWGRWAPPVAGFGVSAVAADPGTRLAIRVAEVAVGTAAVVAIPSTGRTHPALVVTSAVVAALAWLAWIASGDDRRCALPALAVLAASGGVCTADKPLGALMVAVASAGAAFTSARSVAPVAFAPALAGFLVATGLLGAFPGNLADLVAAAGLATAYGAHRRQIAERAGEAALLATTERRLVLADREAQLGAERNRLGREIHDLLAHTMGTVSIQLTALETRIGAGDPREVLLARVHHLHDLVGDGLLEARDAVRALRDERLSLESQIERLCALHEAALRTTGPARPLEAEVALATYRVVQEALTNAGKHAPGAPVEVVLAYGPGSVKVTVANGRPAAPHSPLARTGGGQGLAGMQTRVGLAGGRSTAGPDPDGADPGGWRVEAVFPLG